MPSRDRRDRDAELVARAGRRKRHRTSPDVCAPSERSEHRAGRPLALAASAASPSSRRPTRESTERTIAGAERRARSEPELAERDARGLAIESSAGAPGLRTSRTRRCRRRTRPAPLRGRPRAARFAASKRFGSTSVAAIERDVSIARTIVASSRVTSRTTCGRATPTKSSASATSTSADRHVPAAARRVRGRGSGRAPGSRTGRPAAAAPSRREDVERRRGAGSRGAGASAVGHEKRHRRLRSDEDGQVAEPVAVGRERRRGRRPRSRARAPPPRAPPAAAAANRSRSFPSFVSTWSSSPHSGSTSQSVPTGSSSCSRGSRTSTATTSCRPASWSSGRPPVARAAEVGDDDDHERPLPGRAGEPVERRRERDEPGPAAVPVVVLAQAEQQADEARAPLGRLEHALGARRRSRRGPTRLPRSVAAWPIASVTPSATSALRRSAVPNAIDGEVSSTIHVTSTRSARWTRTCGSVVRAVTFQSISRTSSPGTYGRTCASSVPRPSSAERWSPASSPSTRRAIVSSSALSSARGRAPGRAAAWGRLGAECARGDAVAHWHAAAGLPSSRRGCGTAAITASSTSSAERSSASAWYVSTSRWRNASLTSARMSAGDHVVAAVDEREGARALDERDRPARARAVRDELARPRASPNASGSRVAVARLTA